MIRIFDFVYNRYNSTLRVRLPLKGKGGQPVQVLTTPDGSMLVCLEHDPEQGWLLTRYILEAAGAKSMLSMVRDQEPLPPQLQELSAVSMHSCFMVLRLGTDLTSKGPLTGYEPSLLDS